jgi:hypothetical protein
MLHSSRGAVRLGFFLLLGLLVLLFAWRAVALGELAWQSAGAVRELRAEFAAMGAPGAGGAADFQANSVADHAPQIRAHLQLLAEKLAALDAQLRPLAPGLQALGGLGRYGEMMAEAPAEITAARSLAEAAVQMGPQLEWLLGGGAPRTYLLVVQNNHELRATGGFISAFGTLVVEEGKLAELAFADSYDFFSTALEYGPAPAPIQQYMGIQLLVPRDANWSPDLPAAAETIRTLYTRETGQEIDGIVTIDLHAVRHFVAALETLRVEGVETPITAANVEEVLVQLWERPPEGQGQATETAAGGSPAAGDWWARRKDFVPLVASAAIARLRAGDFNPLALATELHAALDDRSLQVWFDQPQLEQVLAEKGWDGGLHPEAGADFLAVVDNNVGYNKVDAVLRREVGYTVTWPDGARAVGSGGGPGALATVTLTYTHPMAAADPGCDPSPRYGETYADLTARCYFDYVRVYAPGGSELIDVSGIDPQTVTSAVGEQGLQVFGGYLVLPPGGVKTVTFTYSLPTHISPATYRLLVQRQSGTDLLPLVVTVNDESRRTVLQTGAWRWPGLGYVTGLQKNS